MARYIDADKLIETIKRIYQIKPRGETFIDYFATFNELTCIQIIEEAIKELPTEDDEEVKHSRWENVSGFDVCNICGTSPAYWEPEPNNPKGYPRYCHNCGAKMDGKDNNVPTK